MLEEIRFSYEPDTPELRSMSRHVTGQWRTLSEVVATGIMLCVLYLLVQIAIDSFAERLDRVHTAMPTVALLSLWGGITLGLAGAYLCMIFVSRYRAFLTDRESVLSNYRQGTREVLMTRDGVRIDTPWRSEWVHWGAVRSVVHTPLGAALRFDHQSFLPIFKDRLPERVGIEDCLSAISAWRADA